MVEESGGKWGMERFLVRDRNTKPNIPNLDIHDMGAYDIPDIMVCQVLNTAPKMCRNVTKL